MSFATAPPPTPTEGSLTTAPSFSERLGRLAADLQRLDSRAWPEIKVVLETVYPDPEESEREKKPPVTVHATAVSVGAATAAAVGATGSAVVTAGSAAASKSPKGTVAALVDWLTHPKTKQQVMLQDKLCFALSLVNVMLSAFLFGFPRLFIHYFVVKAVFLLGARFVTYRQKGWHYYLLEFCYVAIALGVVHTTLTPRNATMHKLVFALMAGVLTPATIATRNSFVLHSVDKMTSLFQHLTPTIVAWLLRWQTARAVPGFADLTAEQQAEFSSAGFRVLTLTPAAVWLVWAAVYYVFVFVLSEKTIAERGFATMFKLQTKSKDSMFSKIVARRKNKYEQYALYLGAHGSLCLLGCLLNNITFHSCLLHTLYVLAVLGVSVWNGAGYYIHVFPKKYAQALEEVAAKAPQRLAKEE
ncbi:hypothetical protein FOA52_013947 [Chlamydomonas sp. UWO 241]|nr:hypothetical protein FOA52_013947 [Chlamydomonas sp. UWO 241]